MKLFGVIPPDQEVANFVMNTLSEFLKDSALIRAQKESKVKLFTYLIVFHILNRISNPPLFISYVFTYEDIVSREAYFRAKEFFNSIVQLPSENFDGESFAWWYAKLATNCITSENVKEKLTQVCIDIEKEELGEFFNMLSYLLKNQGGRWTQEFFRKVVGRSLSPAKRRLVRSIVGSLTG